MKKCVFAGTFDPFTVGHEDTVNKSLAIFDEVVVALAENRQKQEGDQYRKSRRSGAAC